MAKQEVEQYAPTLAHDGLDNGAVLKNVWQRLAGHFCHLTVYTLECHIIYLLFKNSKSVLQVKIILCRD
jgi:hypothetical protein